jgi:hypothetical protein
MRYFSSEEIWLSIISALIYGAIFEIICIAFTVLTAYLTGLLRLPKSVFFYRGRLLSTPYSKAGCFDAAVTGRISQLISHSIGVVCFFVGLLLLSYYCLDGIIRIYVLVLVLSSLYLTRVLLRPIVTKAFFCLLRLILSVVTVALRIITYLPRLLLLHVLTLQQVRELSARVASAYKTGIAWKLISRKGSRALRRRGKGKLS